MSTLAAARRRLAELAAPLPPAVPEPDEQNEVDELNPPADPTPLHTALSSSDSFNSSLSVADLTAAPAFADFGGRVGFGESDRLLAALRRQAAGGDTDAAGQAVRLADYLAACDRGEVVLPEHPREVKLLEWNAWCSERAALSKPVPAEKSKRHRRVTTKPLFTEES